jgi:hypothetical protein
LTRKASTELVPRASRARLDELTAELGRREEELSAFKRDLHVLQTKYLNEIGVLYAELAPLDVALAEAEIRAGLRPPPEEDDEPLDEDAERVDTTRLNRAEPSTDLKRAFRDVAKAIHPDLAFDDAARYRRHSLMAEANRAYAERDEDRLRLILRAWEQSPESVVGDDPESDVLRVERRSAEIADRLVAIDAEFADLKSSAIHRLKLKIDDAKAQGWDLFSEMRMQVEGEIRRTRTRLAKMSRI